MTTELNYSCVYAIWLHGILVFFRTQTNQALIVDENTKRRTRRDENIDTEVKFETIDEEWIGNILLHNALSVLGIGGWHALRVAIQTYT